MGGKDSKLIYRHYATLYFVFAVDSSESELGILDLIQVFVESLDKRFENVCELDLIFHVEKVRVGPTSHSVSRISRHPPPSLSVLAGPFLCVFSLWVDLVLPP